MRSESNWCIAMACLRRIGSSLFLTVAFLTACGGDSANTRGPSADEAALPGVASDTLEGLLTVGAEGLTFRACDSGQESWVIESPGADLRAAAGGLSVGAGEPMFARLVGGVVAPPAEGPRTAYTRSIAVRQWVYLAEDTSACPGERTNPSDGTETASEGEGIPVLPAGVILRALGNEPFWHVDVSPASVLIGRLGFDDIEFPNPDPFLDNGTRTWSGEAGGHLYVLVVEQTDCPDTMVDRTYPFTALLTLDEQELAGCALEAPGGQQ